MAVIVKLLSCKSLSSTTGTAGTPTDISPISASAKGWLIKNLFFYNNGTGSQTVTMDLKIRSTNGGTARTIAKGLTLTAGLADPYVLERDLTLDLTVPEILSAVLVSTGGAPAVDCVVNGVERDQ